MPKIERRRRTIRFYQGHYEDRLNLLRERVVQAEIMDRQQQRMSSKSLAAKLAREHDKLAAEAEETAVDVTVWAISRTDWSPLADRHPPRDGEVEDRRNGVNMETFTADLVLASLVEPDAATDLDDRLAKGRDILDELGDLSQAHWRRLEIAAWEVNVTDDDLPKSSLVSLLQQSRKETGSGLLSDGA